LKYTLYDDNPALLTLAAPDGSSSRPRPLSDLETADGAIVFAVGLKAREILLHVLRDRGLVFDDEYDLDGRPW